MRPLLSCVEAGELDRETRDQAALPEILLMEDASMRLWEVLSPLVSRLGAGRDGKGLVALCGAGNNAGDALALLRHARFAGLADLSVVLGREGLGEPSATFLGSLRALGLPILSWEREREACLAAIRGAGLLVDGIAGTGLRGALRGSLAELVAAANAAGPPIASVDLPSGLRDGFEPGDPAIAASWTASIEPGKAALYAPALREACGEILPVEGVFPRGSSSGSPIQLIDEADLEPWLPPDSPELHKGRRGRLAVFAGAAGSSGAACLASRSGLAAGAGLVGLYADPELAPVLASRLEAVMVHPMPDPIAGFDSGAFHALLVGPGWGRGEGRRAALGLLLSRGLPAVLDADGIRVYAELLAAGFSPSGPLVLTPHPGEYAALTGLDAQRVLADPAPSLREWSRSLGAVIALKAQVTWIAAPDGSLAVWEGRESGLATAGSGDVLAGLAAGILAGLAAAGLGGYQAAFDAARAAVVAHGLAGRRSRAAAGWFEAGELVAEAARILGGPR